MIGVRRFPPAPVHNAGGGHRAHVPIAGGLPVLHGGLPVLHGGLPVLHGGPPVLHGGLPVPPVIWKNNAWRFSSGWRASHCVHGKKCTSIKCRLKRIHPKTNKWSRSHCWYGIHCNGRCKMHQKDLKHPT